MKTLTAIAAVLALATPAVAADATAANKRLVVDFFNFAGTRAQRAEQMLTADYVQHNPRFLAWEKPMGLHAREAWVKVLPDATAKGVRLVELGGISLRRPIIVMVENDLMLSVYRGRLPVPGGLGAAKEAYAFEAFRMRDGRFSEHWDQVRLAPGWMTPSATPLAPGQADEGPAPIPQPATGCAAPASTLAANKRLMMAQLPKDPARSAAFVLADCDYAAVVWSTVTPDPDHPGQTYEAFTFDAVRIAGGKIAEHWDSAPP